MGAAVPAPDASVQQALHDARASAIESLQGKLPDPGLGAQMPVTAQQQAVPAPGRQTPPQPTPGPDTRSVSPEQAPGDDTPPPTAQDLTEYGADEKPPPQAEEVQPSTPLSTAAGHGFMQGALSLARLFNDATDPRNPTAPAFERSISANTPGQPGAVHDAIKGLIDQASEYWSQMPGKMGLGAQLVHEGGQLVPSLMLGPAAVPAMVGTAANDTRDELKDQGVDNGVASAAALVVAAGTFLGAKIPLKGPLLKRVLTGFFGNEVMGAGTQAAVSEILSSEEYKKASEDFNPFDRDSLIKSGIMGAIFGVLGGKHVKDSAPKDGEPAPDLGMTPGQPGAEPPPPSDGAAPATPIAPDPNAPPSSAVEPPAAPPPTAVEMPVPKASKAAKAKATSKAKAAPVAPTADQSAVAPATDVAQTGDVNQTVTPEATAQGEAPAPPKVDADIPDTTGTGFKAGDKRVMRVGKEDVAVRVMGPAKDGKVPVAEIGDDGKVNMDIHQVPVEMFDRAPEQSGTAAGPTEESSASAEPASAVEPPKEVSPPAAEDQPAPTEAAPQPPTPDLQKAVDLFKQQEIPPAGKKFPGKIAERAQWVSEFARAVKAAAAGKDVPDEIANDATAAAKAAERLDMKTPEAMEKNQGIGHTQLKLHGDRLLQAAQNILDPANAKLTGSETTKIAPKAERLKQKAAAAAAPASEAAAPAPAGKPPVPTKAEQLKAAQAARLAAADKRQARVESARKLVKSAIPDVDDVTKPKVLNAGETARIRGAVERYMRVGDSDVQEAHDNLDRVLKETYGPAREHESDAIMQMAREQRTETNAPKRPKSMAEEVEDEVFNDYRDHEGSDDEEPLEDQGEGRTHEYDDLDSRLDKFWQATKLARDTDSAVRAHAVLDHLIKQSPEGALKELYKTIRANVPDRRIFFKKALTNRDGSPVKGNPGGQYDPVTREIHLLAPDGGRRTTMLRIMTHELVHASTYDFMRTNPDHPLVRELNDLHNQANTLMGLMSPELSQRNAEDYRFGRGEFYGLRNPAEFVAEALANPAFQRHIVRAGKFGQAWQQLRDVVNRISGKIAQIFGVNDNRQLKLFHNVMDVGTRLMQAQKDWYENSHIAEAMERLNSEDHPLEHEDEFRSVAGEHATTVSRAFRQAVRSKAIESVRRGVRAFTPYSGLVRAALRRGVFGADTADNPLRQYDEQLQQRNAVINQMLAPAHKIVSDWSKMGKEDFVKLGRFLIDSTTYGIDPRSRMSVDQARAALPARITDDPKFTGRWKEFQDRWANLSDEQRGIYSRVIDYNEEAIRRNRKIGVDAALDAYSEKDIPKAQRRLLYSVQDPSEYESLVGHGKEIDVGDRNDKLIEVLKDLAGTHELEGPYAHLGRSGDHVVQVNPEGTKSFATRAEADAYADKIRDLSRISKAKVAEVGGKWQVDYKASYVSMHESINDAQAEIERLRAAGYDVGSATTRLISSHNAPLTAGLQDLIAETGRRLERRGGDDATTELQSALRNSFIHIMAARSAYAGSKLARRGVGGVKPEEMLRNFAVHSQSMSWNSAHLATVFRVGDAMGKLREAVKDDTQAPAIANQRGRVYDELTRRIKQENAQVGIKNPANAVVAKVGFLNYLTSASHTLVNLTQNITTAGPAAAARYGFGRSASAFGSAMRLIASPSFRETMRALGGKQDADGILKAVVKAVAADPRFGKYARGENSALQQLIDRGAVHQSFSNQLASTAIGNGGRIANRVFDYARLLPAFADMYNRVSTGLAALELTNGDVYKAGDFVRETHMDYSNEERPRAYKAMNRIWGGNSVFMFKTYMTGMAHLLYSHIYDMASGDADRGTALKMVAGMMLGTAIFSGLQRSVGLEPLRLAMYAYHKLAGDADEYHDFDNTGRRWVADAVGQGKVADVINGGLPRLFGFDMSSRLGLSDLMLHNVPDLLAGDGTELAKFGFSLLGPGAEEMANTMVQAHRALESGRVSDFIKTVPIKILQNVFDAYQYGTQGKVSPSGAKLMEPSAWAAFVKAVGFKTADEAKIQEKEGTSADYKNFAGNRKYELIKEWVSAAPEDRAGVWGKIQSFNADNPGHRVTYGELLRQQRGVQRQEDVANDRPGRDPVQNNLLNY